MTDEAIERVAGLFSACVRLAREGDYFHAGLVMGRTHEVLSQERARSDSPPPQARFERAFLVYECLSWLMYEQQEKERDERYQATH